MQHWKSTAVDVQCDEQGRHKGGGGQERFTGALRSGGKWCPHVEEEVITRAQRWNSVRYLIAMSPLAHTLWIATQFGCNRVTCDTSWLLSLCLCQCSLSRLHCSRQNSRDSSCLVWTFWTFYFTTYYFFFKWNLRILIANPVLLSQVWPGETVFPDYTSQDCTDWWVDEYHIFSQEIKHDALWIVSQFQTRQKAPSCFTPAD